MYAWIVSRIVEGLIARLNRGDLALIHDVTVAGPPWSMRIGVLFSDRIPLPGGGHYSNAGMEYVRVRGGRLEEIRVHLDTEKVAELDERLESAGVAT
jgi:hypothetical protein